MKVLTFTFKTINIIGRIALGLLGLFIVVGCVLFVSESANAVKGITSPTKIITKTIDGEKVEIIKYLKGTRFPIVVWIPVIVGQIVAIALGVVLGTFCIGYAFIE